jgi:hypothetical protein
MSDSLKGCDEVKTMSEAQRPVITPLLPINGLRHDESGNLTDDAIKTVINGLTPLGINVEDTDTQNAILIETKQVLCNLNNQYQFLLTTLFDHVSKSETIPTKLLELLQEKNMAMRNVISVSRRILIDVPADKDGKHFIEGWTNVLPPKNPVLRATVENYEALQKELTQQANILKDTKHTLLGKEGFKGAQTFIDEKRTFEISEERLRSVSANLALYSFLNVIAVGLLFYIVCSK